MSCSKTSIESDELSYIEAGEYAYVCEDHYKSLPAGSICPKCLKIVRFSIRQDAMHCRECGELIVSFHDPAEQIEINVPFTKGELKAIAQERERCARVAESLVREANSLDNGEAGGYVTACEEIAAKIREGV